jgi:hypothetical protein
VFCCSGRCGSNRRCTSNGNKNGVETNNVSKPSIKPTRKPKRRPTNAPTEESVTTKPSRKPSQKPAAPTTLTVFTSKSSDDGCDSGEIKVTVEIKTGVHCHWSSNLVERTRSLIFFFLYFLLFIRQVGWR